ncbi:MAG: repeat protein [Acidimicrobiales bacterium]|nr:repeat protein [Acidimicrobiales bacterium]
MSVWNLSIAVPHPFAAPIESASDRANDRLERATREARAHLAAGRPAEAAARLAPELSRRWSMAVPDELLLMVAHTTMGVIAKGLGDFSLAQRHYHKVARSRSVRENTGLRSILEHNLADLAHSRGALDAAERHSRAALVLCLERHGGDHVDTLEEMSQLGTILSEQGATEEALEMLLRAYDGFVDLHGPHHIEVARATMALAAFRHRVGDLSIAECLYREGLEIAIDAGGPAQPDLAWTMVNLALVVRQLGDDAEATRLLDQAVEVLRGNVASDHPLLVKLQQRRHHVAA